MLDTMGFRGALAALARLILRKPPTRCPLHGTDLVDGEMEIRYGLIRWPSYFEARPKLFPWANSFSLGGCVIPDEPITSRPTRYCPDCREVEDRWKEEDPAFQARLRALDTLRDEDRHR